MVRAPFSVVAYPNPYTETFNLNVTTSSEEKVGVLVYDMTGRLLERREVRPSDMILLLKLYTEFQIKGL